jgi:hypothetical protein
MTTKKYFLIFVTVYGLSVTKDFQEKTVDNEDLFPGQSLFSGDDFVNSIPRSRALHRPVSRMMFGDIKFLSRKMKKETRAACYMSRWISILNYTFIFY